MRKILFSSPTREYISGAFISGALILSFIFPQGDGILAGVAFIAALPTIIGGLASVRNFKINIDAFNTFAFVASFVAGEARSAAFIALMLTFAHLLDWMTESRTRTAVEELLKLKPAQAFRETGQIIEEIPIDAIQSNDVLLVKTGDRVPADGVVVSGTAMINEASVTGESALIEKVVGDTVISSTLSESGTFRMRAERVGKDSTLERMIALMQEASKHKSKSQKLADRFATIFLPVVAVTGALAYFITHNISVTIALFLVACADDMAVAIPLAMTASLGYAARRGVIIKGGEWLDALSKAEVLILDKTGTLTYGRLALSDVHIEPAISEDRFWHLTAVAEKFSEHPVGKALFREAVKKIGNVPDPDTFRVHKGDGIFARVGDDEVIIGDEHIAADEGIALTDDIVKKLFTEREAHHQTTVLVFINKKFAGLLTVADVPRPEAKESLSALRAAGIKKIVMFTGDNEGVAGKIAASLGLDAFRAGMSPEDKLNGIEEYEKNHRVVMVGDGINDAPALARADVGIAMGDGGTAVAVGAADIVILTDDLSRIAEMVQLGRRTASVITWDMILWFLSNAVGFALVLTGVVGPALAAFYNFITDFIPLINSARLFKK